MSIEENGDQRSDICILKKMEFCEVTCVCVCERERERLFEFLEQEVMTLVTFEPFSMKHTDYCEMIVSTHYTKHLCKD